MIRIIVALLAAILSVPVTAAPADAAATGSAVRITGTKSARALIGICAKRYGVKAEHYTVVGNALLWTLERGLGPAWTSELAEAWTTTYTTLAGYMVKEAYGPAAAGG